MKHKYHFYLDEIDEKSFDDWKKKQIEKTDHYPTAGERWKFVFIPTGLGMISRVEDLMTGDVLELTDIDNW